MRRSGRDQAIHRIGIEMVGDALTPGGSTNKLPMDILHSVYGPDGETQRRIGRVGGLRDGSMEWTG